MSCPRCCSETQIGCVICEIQARVRVQNTQSNQRRTQQVSSRDLVIALHHFQDYPVEGSGVINWDNPAMDR